MPVGIPEVPVRLAAQAYIVRLLRSHDSGGSCLAKNIQLFLLIFTFSPPFCYSAELLRTFDQKILVIGTFIFIYLP